MRYRIVLQALALGAFLGTPATGLAQAAQQQQPGQQQQGMQERQAGQTGQAGTQGSMELSGEVTGVRTIRLQGEADPHLLAKVRLQDGQVRVLDLGPVSHLREQKTQVRKGQQVQARGREARINDVAVLVVDRLAGDGVVTMIPIVATGTPQQQRQQARAGHMSAQGRIVSGEVVDTRQTKVRETGESHQLVKVRTRDGNTVVADLGSKPPDVQLQQGDTVLIQGDVGRLNGQPALIASQVAQVAQIDRPPQARPGAPGAQPQPAALERRESPQGGTPGVGAGPGTSPQRGGGPGQGGGTMN